MSQLYQHFYMGYQFPGIGNVAFAGFTSLAKKSEPPRSKKEKDRLHSGTRAKNNSATSKLSQWNAGACDSASSKSLLLKCRQDLRPLLNALRFVESSNRENCPDGDCGASIGPLQISRQYHQDAWKQAPSTAWTRCRDLNHAENTVIAYWLKYCPEAVEKQDFEILAKTHNGGPQGPVKEKTAYYWGKVSRQLRQQELAPKGRFKENLPCDHANNRMPARQEIPRKSYERSQFALSPITNIWSSSRIQNNGFVISPATCVSPKQQTPLVQNLKPKVLKQSTYKSTNGKVQERKVEKDSSERPRKSSRGDSKHGVKGAFTYAHQEIPGSSLGSTNKRHRQTEQAQSNNSLDCIPMCRALNLGYWKFPRAFRREKAAVVLQAFWRMHSIRSHYKRMQVAASIIQRHWRRHRYLLSRLGRVELQSQTNYLHAKYDEWKGKAPCARICGRNFEKVQGCSMVRPANASPGDLVYKKDISAKEEDELLTELLSLLACDTESIDRAELSHSLLISHSEGKAEACTQKLKQEAKRSSIGSKDTSAERIEEKPKKGQASSSSVLSALPDPDKNMYPVTRESLLSPHMEKENNAELENLSPYYIQGRSEADGQAYPQQCCDKTLCDSIRDEKTSENVCTEHSAKDAFMRRLTFGAMDNIEGLNWKDLDEKARYEVLATGVGLLERQRKADLLRSLSLEDSEWDTNLIGSNCSRDEVESDCDELHHIDIPLLADHSPALAPKKIRKKDDNFCNVKTETVLVASLSEWQCSPSYEEESHEETSSKAVGTNDSIHTFEGPLQDSALIEPKTLELTSCQGSDHQGGLSEVSETRDMVHFGCQKDVALNRTSYFSASQEISLCSDTSLLDIQSMQTPPCEQGVEGDASAAPSDILHPDYLLETSDARSSIIYAKALFQCVSLPLDTFREVENESSGSPVNEENTEFLWQPLDERSALPNRLSLVETDEPFQQSEKNFLFNRGDSGSSIEAKTETAFTLLHDICRLWENNNLDLLTRSLKYKNIQAIARNQQELEHIYSTEEFSNIEWQIQSLERFQKKVKDDKKDRELIKRQRDIIYTNIAAYCDMEERYQLYARWKISKILTGRLKRIVYELLWIDPERYQESADLVIKYL